MSASHLRCEAARPSQKRNSENGLANEHNDNRHYQNKKAQMVWACGPKTCRQLRGPCVPPRLPKPKTTRPSAKEMVHPNPRRHRPTPGDGRTQSDRKARLAQRSHGESEVPERNTPISQVKSSLIRKNTSLVI